MALPVLAIPVLIGVVVAAAKPIVGLVIRMIGFGLVAYVGFELAFDQLQQIVESKYSGLPSALLQLFDLMGIDSALQNLFTTMTGIAAYKAFTSVVNPTWSKPGTGSITKEF